MKIAIVLFAALVVGCVTFVPQRNSETQSLVVIKTKIENIGNTKEAILAALVLSDGTIIQVPKNASYITTVLEERGVYVAAVRISADTNMNVVGQTQEQPITVQLPYSAGKIVFAQAFDQTFSTVDTRVDYRYGFRPITNDEKAEVVQSLKEQDNYGTWSLAD